MPKRIETECYRKNRCLVLFKRVVVYHMHGHLKYEERNPFLELPDFYLAKTMGIPAACSRYRLIARAMTVWTYLVHIFRYFVFLPYKPNKKYSM